MKPTRRSVRDKVDAELIKLGHNPHKLSNHKACKALGLIPDAQFGATSVRSSLLLREWAFPSGKMDEWKARIIAEHNADKRYVPKKKKLVPSVALNSFLSTYEWRRVRMEAIKKYGRKCQCCGATDRPINVDHIKPRKIFPELALDL